MFYEGFMGGIIGSSDFSYLGQCMIASGEFVMEIQTAVNDLVQGGVSEMKQVVMDAVALFKEIPNLMRECTAGTGDFIKLTEKLAILADPPAAVARVSFNVMFHGGYVFENVKAAMASCSI